MRYTILLDKNEKTQEVETQEQARFVRTLLDSLEVPIEWNPDESFTIENKIQFKKSLNVYNISIVDDADGGLKVYVNNEIIGEWRKCKYKLREDLSQLDPNKKLYLEMDVNFWSIFEETTNEKNFRT